jgi:hypothetical protein
MASLSGEWVHFAHQILLRMGLNVATPDGGLFDFRLSLAFLGWRRRGRIAALINRSTSGLIRYGNGVAFGFRTRGAYGCAGSAGCIGVGRMRHAESQSKKDSGSN